MRRNRGGPGTDVTSFLIFSSATADSGVSEGHVVEQEGFADMNGSKRLFLESGSSSVLEICNST